jgi:hypothetical protein
MRTLTLSLLFILTGCAQKSDVDKCVDAWEAAAKGISEDEDKAYQRFSVRGQCMQWMAGENE